MSWASLKLKTSGVQKSIRRKATDLEKSLAKDPSDKGPLSEICKELLAFNGQNPNNLIKDGPRTLTEASPEKPYGRKRSTRRDAPQPTSSGKCTLKQRRDTTAPCENGQKTDTVDAKCRWGRGAAGALLTAGGNATRTAIGEGSLARSYKTKHALATRPSNHAPLSLPKGTENLRPREILHMDVCSSFVHPCRDSRATKWSLSQWMDK